MDGHELGSPAFLEMTVKYDIAHQEILQAIMPISGDRDTGERFPDVKESLYIVSENFPVYRKAVVNRTRRLLTAFWMNRYRIKKPGPAGRPDRMKNTRIWKGRILAGKRGRYPVQGDRAHRLSWHILCFE